MDISELYTHIFFPGHPSSLPVLIPGRGGGGGGLLGSLFAGYVPLGCPYAIIV